MILGGWFVCHGVRRLSRGRAEFLRPFAQTQWHSCPTNPKSWSIVAGCGSTQRCYPGHPCNVTCYQPVQEEDWHKETTGSLWFHHVTQICMLEGGSGGICSGFGSTAQPSGIGCFPMLRQENNPSFCPVIEISREGTLSYYYFCICLTTKATEP